MSYTSFREIGAGSIPPFEGTDEQVENVTTLLVDLIAKAETSTAGKREAVEAVRVIDWLCRKRPELTETLVGYEKQVAWLIFGVNTPARTHDG